MGRPRPIGGRRGNAAADAAKTKAARAKQAKEAYEKRKKAEATGADEPGMDTPDSAGSWGDANQPPKSAPNPSATSWREAAEGAVTGTLDSLTKNLGPMFGAYSVLQIMDTIAEPLIDAATGKTANQMALAKAQLAAETEGRKKLLEYYQRESDRAEDERLTDRGLKAGILGASNTPTLPGAGEDMSSGLQEIIAARTPPPDIQSSIVQELMRLQSEGTPMNPLLLMNIGL